MIVLDRRARIVFMAAATALALPAFAALDIGDPVPQFHGPRGPRRQDSFRYSLADRAGQGASGALLLPGGRLGRLLDRGPRLRRRHRPVHGARHGHGDRVSRPTTSTRWRSSRSSPARAAFRSASDEAKTVIEGFDALDADPARFRQSPVVRDRAQRPGRLLLSEPLNPDKHVERMLNALRALPKPTLPRVPDLKI